MAWYNTKSKIPITDGSFQEIITTLLFNCPSTTQKNVYARDADGNKILLPNGNPKRDTYFSPVSQRNETFRERGIQGNLLTTILTQIKHHFRLGENYSSLVFLINKKNTPLPSSAVEDTVKELISSRPYSDDHFELAVIVHNSDMTYTDNFYYQIRNAFAHGAFEVYKHPSTGENIYLLQTSKDGIIKSQMRLKEETLLDLVRLAQLTPSELKSLQRSKHR